MLHIALHFIIPALVAAVIFRKNWQVAYVLMIATMLVDIDHLFAEPIYDPNRCSIGLHPFHQLWLIGLYIAMCFTPYLPKIRLVGIGLSIHMLLDTIDCQVTNGIWIN
jgi:hypothetical protein